MSILWISVITWILILKGHVGITQVLTEAPVPTLKECIQGEDGSIECQDFKQEKTDTTSLWPPGPFVLPMTRYGCPESSMHGWREGSITITLQELHSVYVHSNISDDNFTESDVVNITTTEHFFSERHYIFFPMTPKSINLRFCYKYRSNASEDIGTWPDENYGVFGVNGSCPPDFEKNYLKIKLPNISRWDSDGYLPDFDIFNNGVEETMQIQLCSRRKGSNNSSFDDDITSEKMGQSVKDLYRNWTIFFLLKSENESCPTFQNTLMFEESVYIEQHRNMSTSVIQMLDILCFYELNIDEGYWLFEMRRKYAYSVDISSVTHGSKTISTTGGGSSFLDFLLGLTPTRKVHFWKIVDVGRTIPVSAVDITVSECNCLNPCKRGVFGCFISWGKWNFLHSEALSCLYVIYCRVTERSASFAFKRVTEGRYITLVHEEEFSGVDENKESIAYTVNIFTQVIEYDASGSCNTDLGMRNLNIEDDQITASSWLPGFAPPLSRPYSQGWCPQMDDNQPYLKIVFPMTTTVDGLTLSISRETIVSDGLRTFVSFGGPLLTFTYSENDNSTMHIKQLRTESSQLDAEAITFWFLIHIRVKMIKLSVEKEPSFDLACIRFELHGCMPNEKLIPITTFKRDRKRTPYIIAYTSEIYVSNSVLTNIGYPKHYQSSESYKWIVQFPESHFIKLVFTNIDFNTPKELHLNGESVCNDSIRISNDLFDNTKRVIDYRFKITYSLSIETKETQLVLSFVSCPISSPVSRGNGFRAIATYQDVPACFSFDQLIPWYKGATESCRHPSMFITSMSYLGFQFLDTVESWNILIPTTIINLRFLEFHVPCRNVFYVGGFTIIIPTGKLTFCNSYKPPDSLNLTNSGIWSVSISYDGYKVPDVEGFRMFYTLLEEPERRLVDHSDTFTKVTNVALRKHVKCSFFTGTPKKIVDGDTFIEKPDLLLGACIQLINVGSPIWLLIDLRDLFVLDYIVLYGAISEQEVKNKENCLFSLSTGLKVYGLHTTGHICGNIGPVRTISQKGIKTRFIRLQCECFALDLCELEVYGILESLLDETAALDQLPANPVVNGEWGIWSPWSDVCFCDGKQYRHRLCDDPKQEYNGGYCPGKHASSRPCKVNMIHCEVYDGSFIKKEATCKETTTGYNGFSSWSKWSSCSSNCGQGLMSRTRKCIIPEHPENGKHCVGDLSEEKPCTGNGTCQICSKKFLKCYSIISKYTNWEQARLGCLERNMTLVSILSLSEMRFVKYLLRERRLIDGLPNYYFNADYYVHIGLQLRVNSTYRVPVWENGYRALYFTAWKENEPSSKNCVRMRFQHMDVDDTWESEDCKYKISEYTMCEFKMKNGLEPVVSALRLWTDDEKEEVPETISSKQYGGDMNVSMSVQLDNISSVVYQKYLGTLNTTFSGKKCQTWDAVHSSAQSNYGKFFQEENISDAANYCRDVGNAGFLWCYTEDAEFRWEPCLLNEIKSERRCATKLEYTGMRNTTITGKECIRWDKAIEKSPYFSKFNIEHVENYCRDPLNFGFSWCYIDSYFESGEWEPCQLEEHKNVNISSFIAHSEDEFICSDGEKIPQYLRCDGKFDCEDKIDETECLGVYTIQRIMKGDSNVSSPVSFEGGLFFRCKSGEWISVIAKCDGIIDCFDASDETDSHCYIKSVGLKECTKEQFQCDNGYCIHISQICNFVDDCNDASDEYCVFEECSLLTDYRCRNGKCIPLSQRCDSVKHCPDGSDETECDSCQANAFHCDLAVCIPMRLKCDNFTHCEDRTDETSCEASIFTSCQDVWKAGYRKSGYYKLGDVYSKCQFENVYEKGTMKTVIPLDFHFQEMNFIWTHVVILGMFYNTHSLFEGELESRNDFSIFYNYDGNCTQQVIEVCLSPYEAIARLNNDSRCRCGIVNFDIQHGSNQYPRSIEVCPTASVGNMTLSLGKAVLENTDLLYAQSTDEGRHVTFRKIKLEPFNQIKAGPAICIHNFTPADDDFICNIDGKHIPVGQRCVYDIDASGFPSGCTDGSHLINCETFDCPQSTLKCPESYCIPHRFVCDGILQCPGGEDEEECGCVPSRNEILIIYDVVSSDGAVIAQFARQFYTQTNIVRLLSYKASKPLETFGIKDILLDVHDIEVHTSPDIEATFACHYKVFARTFLDSLYFTNDGKKGVISIQTSEISTEVFRAIVKSRAAFREEVRIYQVSQYSDTFSSTIQETIVSNFTDIRVRRWRELIGIGAEYFSEICKVATKVHCPNRYKCSASKSCIPMEQVCDGHTQCLHGDDEVLCDFQCPLTCTCVGYFSNCSSTNFDPNMIHTVPKNTRHLDFSFNGKLGSVLDGALLSFAKLSVLNVSSCNIVRVSKFAFIRLRNLRSLDLSFNKISTLSSYVFASLVRLSTLNLRGNFELSVIETNAFDGLSLVQDLDLANAQVIRVSTDTFVGLKLKTIDLSNNKLQEIENYAFRNSFVESINFERNDIKQFHKDIFTGLIGLKILKTPAFKFCCIRPNYVAEQNCYPHKDEFSSCDDLMRHSGLQFMIWLIGIMALLGNALSILYRIKFDRERLKLGYGIFVTNLAMADFLMAIYLLIIAIADSTFRKRYIYVDDYWRHSVWCKIAGVLSTTSSEASVLFLCLITLDRLFVIKFPFGDAKITTNKATACALCAWLFSFSVALFPIAYKGYFKNEFYSKSGVCIALPLTRDRPPGWAYSLALFVCLNFITFILVALGQLSIFLEIRKNTGIATSVASTRKRDLKVARNLLLVVATDFLCWFPIGVMGMLALTGHPVSGEVYAWAAVFILPVNSALNPLLYTLSAIIGAKSFSPSTDEQSFNRLAKEIGVTAMKCLMAGHHIFRVRTISTFRDLSTLSTSEVVMTSEAIAKIVAKLALSLDALHCSSLGINPLDEKSVLVGVRNKKLTGIVKIKGVPFISYKSEDKQKNIYELGIILKSLIAAKKTRSE